MAENNQIVIDVKINTDEVAKKLGDAQKNIDLIKSAQKMLTKEFKEGTISSEEYGKAIAANKANLETYTREVKSSTALLQAETLARNDDNSSLDAQRQLLNAAQKAYGQLSGAEKEAADQAGGLRDQINDLSEAVKKQEAAIGDNRRNVGNYTEVISAGFDQIEKSAGNLAPAVSILRSMGGQGKKLGDALDMLGKVMQIVAKGGKAVATTQKAAAAATTAQATATKGATVAQEGLNVAMAANPIGLIVAGISTLLPLIQSFISDTGAAEEAQKKFNAEQEKYNNLLAKRNLEDSFEIELMKLEGATEAEIAKKRQENLARDWKESKKAAEEKKKLYKQASGDLKQELYDEYRDLVQQTNELAKQWKAANNAYSIALLKQQKEAEEASKKRQQQQAKNAQDMARGAAAAAYENAQYIQKGLDNIATNIKGMLDNMKEQTKEASKEVYAEISKVVDMPAPDVNKLAQLFGLDEEGVAFLQRQLDEGVLDPIAAAEAAVADMTQRNLQDLHGAMSQWLGEIMNLAQTIGGYMDARGEAELQDFKDQQDAKTKALDDRLKKGIISEKQYEKEKAAIDAQTEHREKELALEQAKRSKALSIMQAVINTALAVINAFATMAWPASIAAAAIAAATGAASIATIAAEPLPKFATGGVVPGTSYTGDNVSARLNSGEMVLNRDQQARLFNALDGGQSGSLGVNYELLASAMANTPAPVLVYTELEEFGQKTATIQEIASI